MLANARHAKEEIQAMTITTSGGDRQRRTVLRAMMVVTALGGLLFAVLNLYRGLWPAAVVEFAFVAYSLILLPIIGRTPRFRAWAVAYVIPWTGAMLSILAMPGASPSVFVWPILLPLVLHFLLGSRLGLAVSLASFAGAALLAWYRFGMPAESSSFTGAANFSLAGMLGLALAHVYERGRERSERRLREMAATDTLTGLPNRNLLEETFERLRAAASHDGRALSILLMDLDHFKDINDAHGHAAGDRALVAFAHRLRSELRDEDFLCRFGGEEFLALLPGTTKEVARQVAERLRLAWREQPARWCEEAADSPHTVSVGIATVGGDGADLDTLLRSADQRLYRAKAEGRDRIVSD
ncbi:GGDEF domain-containing protein [Wenzhouxiangella sediminis]|uniref:diguanylate cyclase n=1 Tax=Wenzhouxiangella sediminis TaxID=1792836 RepID=A0A3E1KB38_9GAMM|nr:GGDEF domain-containing protein [Wenzhouxiangella sediminis]RFF31731.1 GGDEF domain-containing protein [Wenzhouxiangella sediminis]